MKTVILQAERLRDQVFGQVCNITSNIATVKKVESNGV